MNNKNYNTKIRYSLLAAVLFFVLTSGKLFAVIVNSSGTTQDWNLTSTWVGGVLPQAGDAVVIQAGHTVNANINSAILLSLTVNGTLNILNSASASVSLSGAGPINVSGTLNNNGAIDVFLNSPLPAFNLTGTGTYVHNPRNSVSIDESIFYNTNENFSATSQLTILKWYDETIPLGDPTRVNLPSNFGNVTLSVPGVIWNMNGTLALTAAPWNRIKGTFNVTAGIIDMDDGSGNSTHLTLQDVNISGTGSIIFQQGQNRDLALITGNFSDISTAVDTTVVMYHSYPISSFTWTVNGSLNINHHFTLIEGTGNDASAPATVTVNGNATFNTGDIEFIKLANATLTVNVTGTNTTTIGPTIPRFRMVDGNTGNLNFTTGYLTIAGGTNNIFMGGVPLVDTLAPQATGIATVTVTNDFLVTGTTQTYIMRADQNTTKTKVTCRDFTMSAAAADIRVSDNMGAMTFKATRDFTITGGYFTGLLTATNAGIDSVVVGQNFLFNSTTAANYFKANLGTGNTVMNVTGAFHLQASGTALGQGVYGIYGDKSQMGNFTLLVGGAYTQDAGRFNGIYDGAGNMTFTSNAQPFTMNGGEFKGINYPDSTNAGTATFSLQSMSFNGGSWMMHYGINSLSATGGFTTAGNCAINFAAASDQFMFIGLPYVAPANNTLVLNLTVGGNFSIGGANGTFVSSKSGGGETVNITGNFSVSGGTNSFNIVQNSGFPFGHGVTMTITGSLNISGGTTFLSAEYGGITATIGTNVSITGGNFSIKGAGGFSSHNITVNGTFTQSGGSFYLHDNSLVSTNAAVNVTVNGDFTHSGGTLTFDTNPSSASSVHVLNIKGANYNLSGTGVITSAGAGTGSIFGMINFNRAGSTNYSRGGSHNVQQVKQYILSGTTLVVNSGNLQIASNNSFYVDIFSVQFGGILDLKGNQIFSNASNTYSSLEVRSTARVRIQRAQGLYDNTNMAAISNVGNMNYFLSSGGIVEYYGTGDQVLTGIGWGNATLAQHKYGILDINSSAPAGQGVHVSSGTDSVFVRSNLNLINGELNLDVDHTPSNGGGRIVTIENPINTAIAPSAPVNSFIRSETEDGSGILRWKMTTTTGAHIVPFGYSGTLIPFTYSPTTGTTGDVDVSTYHTPGTNLPWPPTVTQLNGISGNNSAETVDRFWYINVSGTTPPNPDITLICTAAEAAGVGTPLKAQKWMFPVLSWSNPFPGSNQNPVTNGSQVISSALKSGWWTLVSQANPLPVALLDFSASCDSKDIALKWTTATETNNDHFTLEKSNDGKIFEFLATVKGAGNSTHVSNYLTMDHSPFKGINYYRLSQTDFNGHSEVFNIISTKSCTADGSMEALVTPNDEYGNSLIISSPENDDLTIAVFNASGAQVLNQKTSVAQGLNHVDLRTKTLTAGIYLVKIIGNTETVTKRFIINR